MEFYPTGGKHPKSSFELMNGVIDMHCHGFPEISLDYRNTRDEDDDMVRQCQEMGMRGIVLKANVFSAIRECYYLQKQFPDFLVIPSLTLNQVCGGLDPLGVKMALLQGVKVIHMPIWSAWNDIRVKNFSPRLKVYCKYAEEELVESRGLRAVDETGELTEDVKKIIHLCNDAGAVLFTGNLHKEESKKIIEYADQIGYHKVIWCHPLVMDVTPEEMEWTISKGAHIEFIFVTQLPAYQCEKPKDVADLIQRLGAENCILSSDHYDEYSPSVAEMNRLWIATLQHFGIRDEDIYTMMVDNTAQLLGLPLWADVQAQKAQQGLN